MSGVVSGIVPFFVDCIVSAEHNTLDDSREANRDKKNSFSGYFLLPCLRVHVCVLLDFGRQLVENVIREIKPQVVMVELDAKRVGSFLEESRKVITAVEPSSLHTSLQTLRFMHVMQTFHRSTGPFMLCRNASVKATVVSVFDPNLGARCAV